MCRFIGYIGRKILLADLILRPENSLIRQSYKARERLEPLNGDGFGIGWYAPEINTEPGVFKSITPAWSNRNLLNLAERIESGCFFAHVRAASPGMLVSEINCHPFRFGRLLWMHNGTIEDFNLIKRILRRSLSDQIYQSIEGTTDSEHAFAVFLNLLGEKTEKTNAACLANGLVKTVWQLEKWTREAEITKPSIYNFAVSDGENLATVRYVSNPEIEPISLYFSRPGKYQCCNGEAQIIDCCGEQGGVIIASERLTNEKDDWTRVAPNHVVTINSQLNVNVRLMPEC